MCRSIKTLRGNDPTEEEIRAAALQFVRKVSGYRTPSKANEAVFTGTVEEIATSARRLLDGLAPTRPNHTSRPEGRAATKTGGGAGSAGRELQFSRADVDISAGALPTRTED